MVSLMNSSGSTEPVISSLGPPAQSSAQWASAVPGPPSRSTGTNAAEGSNSAR